jgi:dienelactone hydrolase
MKLLFSGLFLALFTAAASAALQTRVVEYKQGDTVLEGVMTWNDAVKGRRPSVLVIHQWMGLTSYEKKRSEMLAQLGYNVFALDIYGKGIRPKTPQEAGAEAGKFKGDRNLLRARALAGLDALRADVNTDPKHIAVIGYCFGGTAAIELARAGADVAGVVTFHGGLDSPAPADGANIRAKMLICHGAEDPFVAPKDMAAFLTELRVNKVDYQFVAYSGAVHSFTQWTADGSMPGAKYNAAADRRSWEQMKAFFAEVLR